jgi:hypothetical protein
MTISADQALKEFDKEGRATEHVPASSISTPSIRLQGEEEEAIGRFIVGKLLQRREVKGKHLDDGGNPKTLVFYSIRLEKTNAEATAKKGEKYVAVPVKENDVVSIMATSRLDRALKAVAPGDRVYVRYDGMKKVQTMKGRVFAHNFTVKSLDGRLEDEDIAYLQANKPKDITPINPVIDEDEARKALETLED